MMLLQCPSCEAVYQLNLEVIPPGKTHAKCKKCETSFPLSDPISDPPKEPKIPIQCTHCGTKYRVKASRLEQTSKVKCTRCDNIFEASGQEARPFTQTEEESILSDADKAYFEAITLDDEPGIIPEIKLDLAETDDLFIDPANLSLKNSGDFQEPLPPMDPELMDLSELPKNSPAKPGTDTALDDVAEMNPAEFSEQSHPHPLPIVEETTSGEGISWGRRTLWLFILLLLALGAVGGGIYVTLKEPSLINYLTRSPDLPVRFVGELESQRIQNATSRQTLFVVEGTLQNLLPTADQMSWIRLKGLAFDENRQIVETSIVYAGNVLSAEELESWSLEKIKQYYNYNSGRSDANFELEENQEVPFQILFFESSNILKNVVARPISYVRQDEIIYVRSGGG